MQEAPINSASDNTESVPFSDPSSGGVTIPLDVTGGDPRINTVSDADVGVTPPVPSRAVTNIAVDDSPDVPMNSAA